VGRRGVSLIAALAAAVASLAAAPGALAASVVFVSEGDLMAASPDGTTVRRIADGSPERPFTSPSVAPDGTIWAIFDGRLAHLDPTGAVLGVLAPLSPTPPVDAVVSPDGTRLAYVANDAAGVRTTWYTRTDGTGGEAELGPQTGLGGPSWLDAARVVLDRGPDATADNVLIDVVEPGATPAASWFGDATRRPADGAVNATLTVGAWATEGAAGLGLYALTGAPPAPPQSACRFSGTGTRDPAWSPDGTTLAWTDADGVWVSAISSLASCTALRAQRIGPRQASEPHWSPLDVLPGLPGLSASGKPRVIGLAAAPRAFPAAAGTTVQFGATVAGTASMAVVRLSTGVRKGRGCIAGRARKKLQRCTVRTPAGPAAQVPVAAGAVALPLARPDLAPGAYELWVVVSDALGRASSPKRARFTVR
jgi:hypothetical protein